jgi:hypothetical protein
VYYEGPLHCALALALAIGYMIGIGYCAVDGPGVFCWKYCKNNPPANHPKNTTNWRVLVYFGYKVQTKVKNHKIQK